MSKKLRPIEVYDLMVEAAWGEQTVFETGQHRLYLQDKLATMVKLRYAVGTTSWVVEGVLAGMGGCVKKRDLSAKVYNEMEVLAWASR